MELDDPVLEAWRELGHACTEWSEFMAYSKLCNVSLFPQEWRTLHEMAELYLEGARDGNPLSIDPEERVR